VAATRRGKAFECWTAGRRIGAEMMRREARRIAINISKLKSNCAACLRGRIENCRGRAIEPICSLNAEPAQFMLK
jgi:hypothetical protein